uniref:uncharacterized protein LOC117601953 n=1 Tax=Osmia lignaria TaxID=473952 RepID=UPI0014790746|nr:uncharacterized protein LOC117601953 [Osmia lignaria]
MPEHGGEHGLRLPKMAPGLRSALSSPPRFAAWRSAPTVAYSQRRMVQRKRDCRRRRMMGMYQGRRESSKAEESDGFRGEELKIEDQRRREKWLGCCSGEEYALNGRSRRQKEEKCRNMEENTVFDCLKWPPTVAYSQRRMVQRKRDCRRRRMMGMYQGRRESSKAEESDGFRGEELKIEDQRRREKWLGCCSGEEYALNGRSRRQKEEKCRNMEENTVFDCLKWPPTVAYSQRRMVQRKRDCRRRRMMGMYQGRRESSKAEESDGFRGEELKIEDQRRREKWLGCCSGEEYALNGRSRRQKEEKCRNMEENTVFDCLKWPPTVAHSQRRMVQRKGDCRRRRMKGMSQGRRESSKAEESDGFRGEELKIEDQRGREKWLGCCSGEEYALNGRSRRQKEEKCRNMEENTVFDCLKWPPVCAPL